MSAIGARSPPIRNDAHIGMRERVIAPIILILTLRGPRRQAGPVIPNGGDVRGCMRVGLLSVTGFPVSLSSAGQSPRASCRPHGVAKALPAWCGRRPCPQMRASIRRQLTAGAARNTRTPEGPARCGRAKRRNPDRGRHRGAWRAPDVPVGGYLSAPRWPLSGRPRTTPGCLWLEGLEPGVQEAEFVAFWVGQNVPALGTALADVGGSGAESEQSLQLGVLVAVGGVDVDVQPELPGPRVGTRLRTRVGCRPPKPASGGPISMLPSSSRPSST